MLSCWCWHGDKRSWLGPPLVSWNCFFFGFGRSLLKGLQVQASTAMWNVTSFSRWPCKCKHLGCQTIRTKHFWLLAMRSLMHVFICCFPQCVIYGCNIKLFFVPRATLLCFLVKCHVWFQTSGLNWDKYKNWMHWIIYTTHVVSVYKLSSTITLFYPNKHKNNLVLMAVIAQAFLSSHIVLWRQFFVSFEYISSLKVECSRAHVWIWWLFEGSCSSWLHPFNKLPPGNWLLF